jgi:hypothetical protein
MRKKSISARGRGSATLAAVGKQFEVLGANADITSHKTSPVLHDTSYCIIDFIERGMQLEIKNLACQVGNMLAHAAPSPWSIVVCPRKLVRHVEAVERR